MSQNKQTTPVPSIWSLYAGCLQDQVTAAVALAMEQQIQKLLVETQLDITEFDNLLQPIIDTCTKDAISVRQPPRPCLAC